MRVLIVSPYPVAPPTHGGRVRVAGLASGLAAAGAEVTLLTPWHPRQPRAPLGPAVDHRVHVLPADALPALAPRLASPQAMLSVEPPSVGPRYLLRRLGRFDVYQFEFCAQAPWMGLVSPGATVVYSAHNVESDFLAAEADRYLLRRASRQRVDRLERMAVQRSDLVLTCSEADASRLRGLYGPHHSIVVPNGCASEAQDVTGGRLRRQARARLGLSEAGRGVLFVGGKAAHNREAVTFLTERVAPGLPAEDRLILAGTSAAAANGVDDARVMSLGWVSDMRPVLAAADVGVNPVKASTGSSVKVTDYLCSGLPVVATEDGARGLGPLRDRVRIVSRERFPEVLEEREPAPPVASATLGRSWGELARPVAAELRALAG
jgi:hypothetical protein